MIYIPKQLWVNTQMQSVVLPIENETMSEQSKVFDLVVSEFETTSIIQYVSKDGEHLHEVIENYNEKLFEMFYQSKGM